MSLHSSSSVNGEGSTPKYPFYKILDEFRSLKLWKEKQERKNKKKKQNHVAVTDGSYCRRRCCRHRCRRPFVVRVRWCGVSSSLVRGASAVVVLEFAIAVVMLEFAWYR